MRKTSIIVVDCVVLLFAAFGARQTVEAENGAAVPTGSLSFYISSDEKIPNGRKVEGKQLPSPVYISAVPDFVLTSLQSVKKAPSHTIRDGKSVPVAGEPEIQVWLRERDVDRFLVFTAKAFRKQILVMIDEKLLAAPSIMTKFTEGYFAISLGPDGQDVDGLEAVLLKLVK